MQLTDTKATIKAKEITI